MSAFNISQTDLLRLKALLSDIKNGAKKVTATSINKTLAGVQTDAVQEVYDDLNITKTRIRQDFKITRASYENPRGGVRATGKPVGLMSFSGTVQRAKGTSVKIKRAAQRTIIKHAFIATAKNARNVWWRALKAGGEKGSRVARLPIERLEGPRIEDILAKPEVNARVMAKAGERFVKNFDYETQRILDSHR